MTTISLKTLETIRTLYRKGHTVKEIREHYNEPENKALQNFINKVVTKIRNTNNK
jgi:hypothetical protein